MNRIVRHGIGCVGCIVGAVWLDQLVDRAQMGHGAPGDALLGENSDAGMNVTTVNRRTNASRMLRGFDRPSPALAAAERAAEDMAPAYEASAWQVASVAEEGARRPHPAPSVAPARGPDPSVRTGGGEAQGAPGQEVLAAVQRMSALQLRAVQEQTRLLAEVQAQLLQSLGAGSQHRAEAEGAEPPPRFSSAGARASEAPESEPPVETAGGRAAETGGLAADTGRGGANNS